MTRTDYRLVMALMVSVLLHLLPFLSALIRQQPPPPTPPPSGLSARLLPPPLPAQVPLALPEQPRQESRASPPPPPQGKAKAQGRPRNWQEEVSRQLRKQAEQGLFYPAEAIAQGLQGEVLVLLIIGENGQVSAARVEQGSGHRILDDAALRAVRALHSLPADAPRETLLPVRFNLR